MSKGIDGYAPWLVEEAWQESERQCRKEIEDGGWVITPKPPIPPATAEDLRELARYHSGTSFGCFRLDGISARLEELARRMEEGK